MSDDKKAQSSIADELRRLATENGGDLQPQVVVAAARDEASPLHNSFDWNDETAGEQWRIQQARQLIRAVVTFEKIGKQMVSCRVFVSLTPDREREGGGYRLTSAVMSDGDHRRQMLADAVSEMQRFKEKYRRLSELAKVFEAMDGVASSDLARSA